MKEFIKNVGATVVGIFVFTILVGAIGMMSLVGMVASGSSAKDVADNTVFVINLEGQLQERSVDNPFSQYLGGAASTIGLDDLLDGIKKAKENDKIKGIYIEAGAFAPDSYASLQAVRKALVDFKKSGKWIVAYGDIYTQATYYVASVADKVYLNPSGQIDWHGLASQTMFLKDALAKFGVQMQVVKVGAYKSATEMFTGDKMSDANREQVTAFLGGIWQNVCQDVAKSRKVSVEQLNQYADNFITFAEPKSYVGMKLVDGLLYHDQLKDEVKKLMKLGKDDDISTIGLAGIMNVPGGKEEGDEIAVYYAYGDIVDGASGALSQSESVIDGTKVSKDLEDLADDDDVKAVVIRINSGGGSAYASEQMWRAIQLVKAKKPVVVSMGGMAASGGYYMSCSANWIVAEPTTLTGSIGIFGMFPDMSGLVTQKLGVKFDEVKTNKNSAFGTMARPFSEEEMAYLSSYISRGYSLFRQRVADGRHMSVDAVEKVAQGHVWVGQDALKIKLVDQLGGLDDAVAKAAKLAKLDEYYTASYPGKADWLDQFTSAMSSGSYIDNQMRAAMGEYYSTFMLLKDINKQSAIQARIPYMVNIK
ncbi:signal peptide peptidase SppA [uncultured Prevotella sp.]|uniref:signal peptide peptidase SppA n=1 Tax=uncultured Prevotella sp. TaxID=159272 RepID=UPI002804F836|nr:signal peptide peptidase SppA [uncultured Prevotella sp.]